MQYPKYPVGRGWWQLLDEYIPKLEQAGADLKNAAPFEKYGTLQFNETLLPNKVMPLLEELEEKSSHICEFCGKEGTERTLKNDWVKTLCSECYAQRVGGE